MDPQQRILLEVVYESIESAGYSLEELQGSSTGVFIGQMTDDYRDVLYRDPDNIPQYASTGSSRAILANRVSYFFDWKGPSISIDTACSSSLVALHQAVQSLRNGEIQIAIVGGVNLILGPETYIAESNVSFSLGEAEITSLVLYRWICSHDTGGRRWECSTSRVYIGLKTFVTYNSSLASNAVADRALSNVGCIRRRIRKSRRIRCRHAENPPAVHCRWR